MRISLVNHIRRIVIVGLLLVLSGCMTAAQHVDAIHDNQTDKITVGTVQKGIVVGMSEIQVVEALGSPNIVSTDSERREVWIYDKLATDYVHSSSSGGLSAFFFEVGNSNIKGVQPEFSQGSGAVSSSQKTLTIIIKFDKKGVVRDFSYRTSRF